MKVFVCNVYKNCIMSKSFLNKKQIRNKWISYLFVNKILLFSGHLCYNLGNKICILSMVNYNIF